jgi:hypothetical protein
MSSIAVQVADIDATIEHLGSVGVRVASRIDDIIVFTDPKTTAGVVIEWYGGESANDPRFGTPIPPYSVEPLLDVREMAFGGAIVDDPPSAAERLAAVFATSITFVDPAPSLGLPQAGVSLMDMTLALFALPDADSSRHLWGHVYERAQTSSLGVRVRDLTEAKSKLVGAGVPLVRANDRMVVVHPDATGGVVLIVVEDLLPGDSRLARA